MAVCVSRIPLSPLALCFLGFIPFICSLSTIAISETANQTLICATIQPPYQKPYLNCSGFPHGFQIPLSRQTNPISGVVAGNGFLCSLSSTNNNSTVVCWRFSPNDTHRVSYKRIYSGPILKELRSGDAHICGLHNQTGDLECWQWRRLNMTSNKQHFLKIAVGHDFVCGLSKWGEIKCLQEPNTASSVVGNEPRGNYSVIGAGFHHACAISVNRSLFCWGRESVGDYPQDNDQFTSLALGESRSCAMRSNGTVTCWGENNFSVPENLRDTFFVAIEAKRKVFCGIVRSNYSLYCWGDKILDSDSRVFDNVAPGVCTNACPCRPLSGYGMYCAANQMVCEPCVSETTPTVVLAAPPPQSPTESGGWSNRMVAFLIVGCVGSTSMVMVCFFLLFRHCSRKSQVHDSGPLDEEGRLQTPRPALEKRLSKLLSISSGCGQLEEFSLQVLNQVTDNFSEGHKIGTGSFGSVYHATLHDGRQVAIKRAEVLPLLSPNLRHHEVHEEEKDRAFLNELEFLSRLNHKNLVRLLGYCKDSDERILVYEYMSNGTVHDHLHVLGSRSDGGPSPLTMSWDGRIKIALDAARGIEYLHVYANPPIVHRDIKSSNILLDANWMAKVSDFGLSLIGPKCENSHLLVPAAGTMGYVDPEYYRLQQLTTKSDVYSFGVLLLELLSGQKAIHKNQNGVPRNVIDFVKHYIARDEIHRILDRNVPPPTPFEIEAVAHVGDLATLCVALQGKDRPSMTEVVNSLERALAECLAPPPIMSRSSTGSST